MSSLPHPITGQRFTSPVPPGTGWPDDPADAQTAVAHDPAEVVRLAVEAGSLSELDAAISVCRACPRLVSWRETVASAKRKSFADEPYWGRPIAGWGSAGPRVLIVGLAPAANGGNRTGRIFTGDRSGDWLFASLHRVGLAAQATSVHAGDGQRLIETRMMAAVRCAPPDNTPLPIERASCAPWLDAELSKVLPTVRAIVCLGSFGWNAALRALTIQHYDVPRPRPRFGHAARVVVPPAASSGKVRDDMPSDAGASSHSRGPVTVLGCYHPSQQNTFTGKLTEPMLDAVLAEAAAMARSD
jgi:uracil-DNA glycosylase